MVSAWIFNATGQLKKICRKALIFFAALFLFAELVVQGSGVLDFPLYEKSEITGYIPVANQSGAFLHKNHWQFNELNMAAAAYRPGLKEDILVIGDSIVIGGNPMDGPQKLGPCLEALGRKKWSVWPIGAASWSALNELSWIQNHLEVVRQAKWLVWSLNSGDFYEFSRWHNNSEQPLYRPFPGIFYVINKYVWEPKIEGNPSIRRLFRLPFADHYENKSMLETMPEFETRLVDIIRENPKIHPILLLYPMQNEIRNPLSGWPTITKMLTSYALKNQFRVIDVAESALWKPSLYRPDQVHPNIEGNAVLARLIADKIQFEESHP